MANYCSFSLFFFSLAQKKDLTWEPWKNISENLSQGRSVDLQDCFDYVFPGESVSCATFFPSNSHHRQLSSSTIQIPCSTFFNHFEESLDLCSAMFSTASTVGDRSHYLIAIASTRQSTCLTGEKISCNPWTNSPSLLKKDCAPLQINFFYWQTKRKERKKRSSNS